MIVTIMGAALAMTGPEASNPQPVMLERRAYRCLMRYIDKVPPAATVVVIDLSSCPPALLEGSYPIAPSEQMLKLTPAELNCLRRARRGDRAIVQTYRTEVALYLAPCGGRRG